MAASARLSIVLFFFLAALHAATPILIRGPISASIAGGRLSLQDAACGTVSILTDSNTKFSSNGLPLAPPNDVEVLIDGTNDCGGASLSSATRLTVLSAHTVVVAPVQSGVVTRLNLGGPAHTDPAGLVWAAETGYTGGAVSSTNSAISGTSRPVLYQSERYGLTALSLAVPSKGAYILQLHFAEQYWNASGKRVFDIVAQGAPLVSGLDLYAHIGKNNALVLRFPLNINSTRLDLTFMRKVDNPTISAAELLVAATTKSATAAPTTKAPTTAAPTTKAPTTKAPTNVLTAPAPAVAAGYTTSAFADDFDSLATINTGETPGTGYKWSRWIPFEGQSMPVSCFSQGSWTDATGDTSTSVLTITQNRWNWNQALYSVDGRNGSGFSQRYGYFEARISYAAEQVVRGVTNPSSPSKSGLADAPSSPIGWPAWWSLAKRHLTASELRVNGTPDYLEIDFHEYYDSAAQDATFGNRLTGTVHDWHGNDWRNTDGHQYGAHLGDPAVWHVYGLLWKPGSFTWYLDGVEQHSITYSASTAPSPNNISPGYVMPTGTFQIADLDDEGVALALGTGNGYPMHIDWVRVWR